MKKYDIIIVGAGISGLSLAHYCAKKGLKTLVIEKSDRVGGTLFSHRFSGEASGFWLELGAHTCYNSYGNLLSIMDDLRLLDHLIKREKVGYKMLLDSEISSIPSRLNFIELFLSAPRLFTTKKTGRSVESYYSRIVGKSNFKKVFSPAFNAVICQRANNFPADMLFKKRPRRKDIMKSFTLDNGIQSITDAVASQQGIEILTGKKIEMISLNDVVSAVTLSDGSGYESRSLALATPASSAAKLSGTFSPELSALLSKIRTETIETVGVAIRKDALSLKPLAGIIAVDDFFYSAVSRDTVRHENYRGFSFHFKAGAVDLDAKLRRIAEVLGIGRNRLEAVVTAENGVPSLSVGHESLVGEIDGLIADKRLLLTGNYFSGLAMEDCVSRSLSEFSRLERLL